ncbi:MAG: putative glycosyltransferase EpsJ [Lentisphaerae bacterium ADurb.Bin082]|nr:MAG: putative glycosyltransferase EpsJ [Lentisphaerae bacterium ADurb.Bin082]
MGKGSFVHLYLTDDGSTDDSLAICRRYASKHSNITVLSQSNAGPSAARNSALAIAQEEYITFLDADDEIEPGTLQKNLEWLQAHPDVDALFYPIQSVHFDGSVTQKVAYTETAVLSKEDAWEKWCCGDKNLPGYFGGKIYARKLFEGLKIPEHLRFAEDMYLLSDLLAQTNKICMSPYGNYRYYERENAATQTPWTESKASNIGEAYFHRWEVAVQLQLSDAGTVNAWRLALAEVVAERKKFPDILAKELDALKSMRPTWAQLLRKLVLRQALGSLLLLFKSR